MTQPISQQEIIRKLTEASHIAAQVVTDAISRLTLFRDEPCEIPDIQHTAAIGVEALSRANNRLLETLKEIGAYEQV